MDADPGKHHLFPASFGTHPRPPFARLPICLSDHPSTIRSWNKHVCKTTAHGQGLKTPSGQALLSHQAESEAAPARGSVLLSPGIQGSLLVLQPGSQTPVHPSACPNGSDGPRWRPGRCPPLSSLPTAPLGVWYGARGACGSSCLRDVAVWAGSPSFRGWAHWTSASLTEIQDGGGPCGHQPGAACTRPVGEETQRRAWIGAGLTVVGCERVRGVGRGPGIAGPQLAGHRHPTNQLQVGLARACLVFPDGIQEDLPEEERAWGSRKEGWCSLWGLSPGQPAWAFLSVASGLLLSGQLASQTQNP